MPRSHLVRRLKMNASGCVAMGRDPGVVLQIFKSVTAGAGKIVGAQRAAHGCTHEVCAYSVSEVGSIQVGDSERNWHAAPATSAG